jgi:hypothetical protein
MIRTLARLLNDPTLSITTARYSPQVFLLHPYQISQWLELAWTFTSTVPTWLAIGAPAPYLGDPRIIQALGFPNNVPPSTPPSSQLANGFLRSGIGLSPAAIPGFSSYPAPGEGTLVPGGLPWDHAAYAMIIESTGVFEILAEVTRRYAIGETLEPPSRDTEQWLRSTEELFFRDDTPLFHIMGITSQFRQDPRVTRRNLYWRLLGMDLPHALPPGHQAAGAEQQPWKRDVGVANVRFHELWVELLRQVWIGYENVTNTSGAKPTDPAYIAEICRYLKDMLVMRRLNGQLAREEFVAVSQLSWFHLTVESDTPLVVDLRAQGSDPWDRLVKIGQRVGMKPSPRSWELFQIADLVSAVLRFIELGLFDSSSATPALYTPTTTLQTDMIRIIDLWEMATGDGIKDQGVRVTTGSAQPQRHAPPAHSLSAATNGHRAGHRPVVGSAAH